MARNSSDAAKFFSYTRAYYVLNWMDVSFENKNYNTLTGQPHKAG